MTYRIVIELEADAPETISDLVTILETLVPYMVDNVSISSEEK